MLLCGVTVLLWALRLCALSRQGCQGQGETMGIGGAPDSGFAELQTSNPLQNQHFPFQSSTLKERAEELHSKIILTSPPRPRSPPQTGCSRRQRRRKLGREFPPGFALVHNQRRRGGTSDCPQGSSWATIQFNSGLKSNLCEKQNPFCEDRQAVLSLGKPLFQPAGRWGSSTSGEGGEERQRGLHVDYWLLIDYRGKVWS